MGKFLRNWVIVLIVWLVISYAWTSLIFANQYMVNLSKIARYSGGEQVPLMSWLILAHAIVALAYVFFLPKAKGNYVMNGVLLGWATFGFFGILNYAILADWTISLKLMDVALGTIGGAIVGWLTERLS